MSSIVVSGNTSGSVTLSAPDVSGSTVLTLPTTSSTLLTTATPFSNGQGPAFSASNSVSLSVSNTTFTKLNCSTESFDTNSNYDTTNYRFTPTVAGYYQINGFVTSNNNAATGVLLISLYKNGSRTYDGTSIPFAGLAPKSINSTLIYMNGSTDYLELYAYQSSGSTITVDSIFNGFLARAA